MMFPKLLKNLLLLFLPLTLLVCNSKEVKVSVEDRKYIAIFSKEWKMQTDRSRIHQNLSSEVDFIRLLQNSVISNIQHQELPHKYFGDLSYYYQVRKGFCYDRAVLMEKILSYYGFDCRHLYVYFNGDGSEPSAAKLLEKATPSHAVFEVKTQNGWMAVGTNVKWLGFSSQNEVLALGEMRNRVQKHSLQLKFGKDSQTSFSAENGSNFRFVYGLYSRHGDFFTKETPASNLFSFHVLPDYNWKMLFYNF